MSSALALRDAQLLAKLPPDTFAEAVEHTGRSSAKQKPTVLVVDDEALIADTLAEILNESGFEATAVYDGMAALEQVREWCPDSIIADVIMPGLNGVEVAKAVRQHCPDTRIFLLSGQAATKDLIEDASAEGYSFDLLAKPIRPETLIKKLSE